MNCVLYKNVNPQGGSVEISGTTCNGVTGWYYINYGETACMDTDYPLILCDYLKVEGPCNPASPTPSVTMTNTPTVTPTTVCNYLTISGSAAFAGVYQRVYGQPYYISGNTSTVICGTSPEGNTAMFSSSTLNRIIVYRQVNQQFYVLDSTGFSGCTNVLGGQLYANFATGFTNVDGYLYPAGWDRFGRDAVIVYPASCSTSPIVTRTPTRTPTQTKTPQPTPTQTPSPSITSTPSSTIGSTPSVTPTNTITPSTTATLTPTNTPTPSITSSLTPSITPTNTNTPTQTNTSTPASTPSNTPSQTQTQTPTATFTCTSCNNWSYSNVPLEGDVIHYYSCENGSSQTIVVSQFESGEFCNCDSLASPYTENGSQLTQMGICLPTPTPSVTPTNTPTPSQTPSNENCCVAEIRTDASLDVTITGVDVESVSMTYLSGDTLPIAPSDPPGYYGTFQTGSSVNVVVSYNPCIAGQNIVLVDCASNSFCCDLNSGGGNCTFTGVDLSCGCQFTITASDGACF